MKQINEANCGWIKEECNLIEVVQAYSLILYYSFKQFYVCLSFQNEDAVIKTGNKVSLQNLHSSKEVRGETKNQKYNISNKRYKEQ